MDLRHKNIPYLPSIKGLRRLAYKKIFEGLSYQEALILDRGLAFYPKTELRESEINALISLNNLLIKNEKGGFGELKEKVIEKKLDYKGMFGLN